MIIIRVCLTTPAIYRKEIDVHSLRNVYAISRGNLVFFLRFEARMSQKHPTQLGYADQIGCSMRTMPAWSTVAKVIRLAAFTPIPKAGWVCKGLMRSW